MLAAVCVVQVLDRLGTLHLVRHTLLKQMTEPDNTFSLGPAYAATLRPFKVLQVHASCHKLW